MDRRSARRTTLVVTLLFGLGGTAFLSGCRLFFDPKTAVATDENTLAYHNARYSEACPDVGSPLPAGPQPYCNERDAALKVAKGAVQEEVTAQKRGGKYPLQKARAKRLLKALAVKP